MSEGPFFNLQDKKYVSLKTYYKNGKGIATPVEFADKDRKLYVNTRKTSWKVKRIQENPNATIAPCTIRGKILGEEMDVTVRILFNDEELKIAKQALDEKFNKGFNMIMRSLFTFFSKIQFWKESDERAFLQISA